MFELYVQLARNNVVKSLSDFVELTLPQIYLLVDSLEMIIKKER